MAQFSVETEYAQSSSDTTAPTTGWGTEKPSPAEGKFIWARNIMNFGYGDIVTEPWCTGDGLEHILSIDVEYIAHSDAFQPPSQSSEFWSTTAPSIQAGQYIWTRTKVVTTVSTNYTDPVRITGLQGTAGSNGIDGRAGKDGKGIEFIFKRFANKIDNWNNPPSGVVNPATLSANQTDDYVPTGWTDDQEEVTQSLPYQYVSTRTRSVASGQTDGLWSQFNTPKLWSTYGEKPYCHIRYADVNPPTEWSETYAYPQTSNNGVTTYHKYEGYLWNDEATLSVANQNPSLFTWRIYRPTIGIAGENGSFLHIMYADDEAGTNMNQLDGDYMGTCVTYEELDPEDLEDAELYNWVRIRGNTGNGNEFVYYTTANASFNGSPSNIQTLSNHDVWCERPYGVSETYPYCYISVRDWDSSNEQWGNWSPTVLWAKFGEEGSQGQQGERGEDGVGLEMIFARNNSTTTAPTFSNYENLDTFTGTVNNKHFSDNDFVPNGWTDNQSGVDSSHTVEWVAMRFKTIGNDGKTASWGSFNTPKVWATYSEDGRGVVSIQEEYAVHTSYSTAPTTGWSTTRPTYEAGKFYWTRSVITYTEGSPTTTTPVCVSGLDGTDVHYIYYCYNSTSTPNPPSSDSDIHTNSSTMSQNYGKWVEDPVPVTYTNQYIYVCVRNTNYVNGVKQWSNWSTPALWSRYALDGSSGSNGVDGKGYEYAYKTTNAPIQSSDKPSGTVTATTGYDWAKVPVPMTATYQYMYISYRTKTGDTYDNNGKWSNSALWSKYGQDGTRATGYLVLDDSHEPHHSSGTNNGVEYSHWIERASVLSDSGFSEILVGDCLRHTNYLYPVIGISTSNNPLLGQRINIKGDTGATGRSIGSVENQYAVSTTTTAPTSASEWKTSISELPHSYGSTYKYLWDKEVSKDTNNTVISETDPSIIGVYGEGGGNIASITEEYILSTSTTASSQVGSWSSSVPTMTSTNKYLWNREVITFSNPTSTKTTTAKIIGVYGDLGYSMYSLDDNYTPQAYEGTSTGGITYYYRRSVTDVLSHSDASVIRVGDKIICGTYIYPVVVIGSTNVGFGERTQLKGEAGKDGLGLEHIFYRSATEIDWSTITSQSQNANTNPANWSADQGDDYVMSGTGWQDDSQGVTVDYQYEYCSIRTKYIDTDGVTALWGTFSQPKLWAKYGDGDKIYEITAEPQQYTNQSYPDRKWYVRFSAVSSEVDTSIITVGDVFKWTTFLYPVIRVAPNIENPTIYFGERTQLRGEDGLTVEMSDIIDEVNTNFDLDNLDATTFDGRASSEFILAEPTGGAITQTDTTGVVRYQKLGNLVIINVVDWKVINTAGGDSWEPFLMTSNDTTSNYVYVPSGYRPSENTITPCGNTSGSNSRATHVRLNSTGSLVFKRKGFYNETTGDYETVSCNFIFFADTRTATTLSWNSTDTLQVGDYLIATLKNASNNNPISGRNISLLFNSTTATTQTTDANGRAYFKLNYEGNDIDGSLLYNYTFQLKFGGDATYKPSTITNNAFYLKKVMNPVIVDDTTDIYRSTPITGYVKNNSSTNRPIQGVPVQLEFTNGKTYTTTTWTNGYFSIPHPNDNIAYNNLTHLFTIRILSNDYTATKSAEWSKYFKP
jgi:hypothetical protein